MANNYWQKRNEQVILDSEKISAQMEKTRLKRAYQEAYKNIVSQINQVQASLTEQGFSADMAKSLNISDKRDYASLVKQYNAEVKKIADKGDYRELKPLSTVIKGSRLTAFKNQLDMELSLLAADKEEMIGDTLQDIYKQASYKTIYNLSKQIGAQVAFDKIDKKTALKAVRTNFGGTNFSDSIWEDKAKLKLNLEQLIPQQFIIGSSSQEIARQIRDRLNVSYRSAIRLARTETNFVANMGMEDTYKRAGVQKYQILATLDSRTSDICQEMDGYIGELSKAVPGVNYPPFHPNCRTTTIPYFDDEEAEERIRRDEEGRNVFDKNMSYNQWVKKVFNEETNNVPKVDPDSLKGADAINKSPNEEPEEKSITVKELTNLKNQYNSLSPEDKDTVHYLTEDLSRINNTIRNKGIYSKDIDDRDIVGLAKRSLDLKANSSFTVYRGDGIEFLKQTENYDNILRLFNSSNSEFLAEFKKNYLGKIIEEPGFRSTSIASESSFDAPIHWIIDIPKNSGGLILITTDSAKPEENELMIAPLQGYQINDIKYDKQKQRYNIYATLKNRKIK